MVRREQRDLLRRIAVARRRMATLRAGLVRRHLFCCCARPFLCRSLFRLRFAQWTKRDLIETLQRQKTPLVDSVKVTMGG